ncbi:ferritin [Speluncibacter jeojiensis]|uniref:Ferritin n=1 Tax=Speluncibacter jeojiensis TaxID=2710754 RepID=A0A9X4LZS4_9ACTN|nr:ferritin [Corynebacteriales bacterium D3-21]
MTTATPARYPDLLRQQVRQEFTAAQQYIAVAVYFEQQDLPQLATLFHAQSRQERNHAMMLVQFALDNDIEIRIPGTDAVRNDFPDIVAALDFSLNLEEQVVEQISRLARTAREEGDYIGEQFVHWFLKEQTAEIAAMRTLRVVARRAGAQPLKLEQFVARELSPATAGTPTESGHPEAAGGMI